MLIVDFYTLQTVNSLYLAEHVILNGTYAFDLQDIVRVYRTFGQLVSGFQNRSVSDLDTGSVRDQVCLGYAIVRIGNHDFAFFLGVFDLCNTRDLGDDSKSFRLSCLEKLLDTRKTLCDISTGNTTGMEGTHGQLCTRLTDRLCCDNSDRLTNLYCLAGCHVGTIAFCADSVTGTAGKNGTDFYFCIMLTVLVDAVFDDTGSTFRGDHMVCFYNDVAVLVFDRLAGETACDTILQTLDLLFSVCELADPHTRNFVLALGTVDFTDDQVLRNVYQTTGQVTGVGGTKRGIGHTFSCSMCGHEVFQYLKTFTEV